MAKFNLGDKVRLKSDVAKRYDIPLYMILTITNIFDCGCVVYRCDETDYLMWTEDDFEDIKYITSSNGQIIGTSPINDVAVTVRGNRSKKFEIINQLEFAKSLNMVYESLIGEENNIMKVKNINMPEIVNYTYDFETGKTTIKWSDKTETTVVSENPDTADQYTGFVTAIAKRATGNTSHINNLFDKWAIKKPMQDKIAEEKRIAKDIENKRIAEKRKAKREKWLIRREAIRIKREYEARKLANEKYGVPMDGE